ncbi:MAG: undecaprenyl/decaprenyl-phosphate alpha-N-acetylglucosaminyl 1-phosphate transferase [Phycisphaerae bacterium]|nr:undecaprenyl/decaprenyl-phosphate alpha-N-acetylglucosaminyl 1-phosphate transferase [Phycisphaerae bacterium]
MIATAAAASIDDLTIRGLISMFLPVLVVAWAVTLLCTPLIRALAIETGVVDHPDEARKIHSKPVAYLGGVAVFFGLLAGIAVSYAIDMPASFRPIPIAIVIGMIAITATGVGDDVWGWDPRFKIMGQLVAAAGLSLFGIGTQTAAAFLAYFFGTSDLNFEVIGITINVTEWVGVGIVAVLVLGACNASNLIDGLDGLLSGTTSIIGGGLLLISLLMALHMTTSDLEWIEKSLPASVVAMDGVTLAGARIALCMALIGATLGFLAHNFNPATIFLGDAGSLLIGYFCVTIILMLGELGQTHFVLAGLIVFGLPIADTILAITRRKVQGLKASDPDANHLHHILKRQFGTVKQAVLGMWAIETIFMAIGVSLVAVSVTGEARIMVTYIVFILLFGCVAVAGGMMGRHATRRSKS